MTTSGQMPKTRPSATDRLYSWKPQDAPRSKLTPADLDGLPPGPTGSVGLQTMRLWKRRDRYLPALHDRYGDIFTLRAEPAGVLVVVRDPDHIRQIFRGESDVFEAGRAQAMMVPMVGHKSVLALDGSEHEIQRKYMIRALHTEQIQAVVALVEELTERAVADWPVGRVFPLLPRIETLSLDIMITALFGDVGEAGSRELARAVRAIMEVRFFHLAMLLHPPMSRYWPWRRVIRELDYADTLIYRLITERRANPAAARRSDILSQLLAANPDDTSVRDGLVTLLTAGHQTSAIALTWTFERLLRHPDALARVRDGLDDPRDPYRTAVVKEALRVRPPLYTVARRLAEPVELAGYRLPAGVFVAPSIGGLHSDTEVWGPDAAAFRPERWLAPDVPQFAWIPFGGGDRRCLGAGFAQSEMETVLRVVLREVDLHPDRPSDEPAEMNNLLVVPKHGGRVRIPRRLA
ncbi:cytochrome P450 [Nocardia iowensis]|uniref:Cytochrome P450 n=2 Tax=Nocardia iowensis TaxID=204891 RepID=A0ABX8RHW1_NOCIO|nr:cytochrome P450 [Nocardia iowensis]